MELKLKILLAVSLLGILLMIFLSNHLEPKQVTVAEALNKSLDEKVTVIGKIIDVRSMKSSDFKILKIKDDTGSIAGTLNSRKLSINESQDYKIIGKISEYNKTIQISIDRIFLLS